MQAEAPLKPSILLLNVPSEAQIEPQTADLPTSPTPEGQPAMRISMYNEEGKISPNTPSPTPAPAPAPAPTTNAMNESQDQRFQLRSPVKATQEEINLTKRFLYINEHLKQQKIIK